MTALNTPYLDGSNFLAKSQPTLKTSRATSLESPAGVSISQFREALRPLTERARQDKSAFKTRKGETGWSEKPLSAARISEHLGGYEGCGIGFISPGESVTRLALLDLDSHKGETSFTDMAAAANMLSARLEARGLRPVVFRSSGGSGIHIWLLWDTPQDAHSVRCVLQDVLAKEGLSDGAGAGLAGGQVEVFPKQDRVDLGRCGNMAVLPLWNKSELLIDELGLGLYLQPVGREAVNRLQTLQDEHQRLSDAVTASAAFMAGIETFAKANRL